MTLKAGNERKYSQQNNISVSSPLNIFFLLPLIRNILLFPFVRVTVRFGPVRFGSGRSGSVQPTYLGAGEQRRHVRRAVREGRAARGVLALVLLGLPAPLALAPVPSRPPDNTHGARLVGDVRCVYFQKSNNKKVLFFLSFFFSSSLSLSPPLRRAAPLCLFVH